MTAKEYARKYYRARYQERKAAGLCPRCGDKKRPEGTYCAVCTDYFRERWQCNAKANRAKGLCACGAPTDGVHKMCSFCRTKQNLATRRWLAKKKEATA